MNSITSDDCGEKSVNVATCETSPCLKLRAFQSREQNLLFTYHAIIENPSQKWDSGIQNVPNIKLSGCDNGQFAKPTNLTFILVFIRILHTVDNSWQLCSN